MIAIASDHGGLELKNQVRLWLEELGAEVLDMGCDGSASVDYPDYAEKVARAVAEGRAERGVLVCGTGIGMSIAANRFRGVRATLVHDAFTARMSRQHNDSNVLVLGGRVLGVEVARDIVALWYTTPYEGDRHQRRLDKLDSCCS